MKKPNGYRIKKNVFQFFYQTKPNLLLLRYETAMSGSSSSSLTCLSRLHHPISILIFTTSSTLVLHHIIVSCSSPPHLLLHIILCFSFLSGFFFFLEWINKYSVHSDTNRDIHSDTNRFFGYLNFLDFKIKLWLGIINF